jgi:NAD(P)-dependent dehydrogenase (short-subunit alcohol dehydrogenase family)
VAVQRRQQSEQEMSRSLDGKRVVILGGTSGIGLATANPAQLEGASIAVASGRQHSSERSETTKPLRNDRAE